MIKKVLIVDDNEEMLFTLREGLKKYRELFSVITAPDGLVAMEELKKRTVSVVVSDLKMPQVDGLGLLAHIMKYYPEIPVIIITAYTNSNAARLAREGGAVGFIGKPFMIEDLARKIMEALRKESEGGTLHNVSSSGMFLQLIEMEQRTCTIRIVEKSSGRQGVLFFLEGTLLDARVNGLRGENAAYEIFSWDEVTLSIQNTCAHRKRKIKRELQAILMDAMRVKDEISHAETCAISLDEISGTRVESSQEVGSIIDGIGAVIEKQLAGKPGVEDIYKDDSWNGLVKELARIGSLFEIGSLKVGYVDVGENQDYILVPRKETAVVSVNRKCPRDRILQILSG
ncbi:MAG: response regulator [Deltaproteobacteria bacterium]|jgi:CheY-like chemotaxis protein